MTIELSGYDMLLGNAVYSKDLGEKARGQNGRDVSLCRYVLPMVYRQPTEDKVVNYLMREAARLELAVSLPPAIGSSAVKTDIAKILMKVPQLRADLRTGNLDVLKAVRAFTPAENISNPPHFVKVMYGILPQEVVEKYSDATNVEDPQWYAEALEHFRSQGIGEQFTIQMPVTEAGKLPDKKVLDLLVGLGCYGAPVFEINRNKYDQNLVGELLNSLYAGADGQNLLELRDVSELELQPYALMPLQKILSNSSQQAMAQQLRGVPGNGGGPAIKLR